MICRSINILGHQISVRASALSLISGIKLTLEFERASVEDCHGVFASVPAGLLRW